MAIEKTQADRPTESVELVSTQLITEMNDVKTQPISAQIRAKKQIGRRISGHSNRVPDFPQFTRLIDNSNENWRCRRIGNRRQSCLI